MAIYLTNFLVFWFVKQTESCNSSIIWDETEDTYKLDILERFGFTCWIIVFIIFRFVVGLLLSVPIRYPSWRELFCQTEELKLKVVPIHCGRIHLDNKCVATLLSSRLNKLTDGSTYKEAISRPYACCVKKIRFGQSKLINSFQIYMITTGFVIHSISS